MKCASRDTVRKIAEKQLKQMIHDTARWSLIVTVWILFSKFHWSKGRISYFLHRYDEQSDMIAPQKERFIPYDDRSKPGYTFDEIHEEVGLDIKLKNSRAAGGKIETEVGIMQDHILHWVLDVILNTLRNKCGWGDTMCRKFVSYYNSQIPLLDNAEENCDRLLEEINNKYGYKLEVTCK